MFKTFTLIIHLTYLFIYITSSQLTKNFPSYFSFGTKAASYANEGLFPAAIIRDTKSASDTKKSIPEIINLAFDATN